MNQIITINQSTTLTMSSLEIAGLVQSNHADVRRSIERLAGRGVITLPPLAEVPNPSSGPKTITVYQIGKRDTYVIVAQLSPEFTARLVDRWQELEEQVRATPITPALPDFSNPAVAARAWAEQFEQRQLAEAQLKELEGLGLASQQAQATPRARASKAAVTMEVWANRSGITLTPAMTSKLGWSMRKLYEQRGLTPNRKVRKTYDLSKWFKVHQQVKTYRLDLLNETARRLGIIA